MQLRAGGGVTARRFIHGELFVQSSNLFHFFFLLLDLEVIFLRLPWMSEKKRAGLCDERK